MPSTPGENHAFVAQYMVRETCVGTLGCIFRMNIENFVIHCIIQTFII